jgi:tetratricopeptide (TPR) repeat protein
MQKLMLSMTRRARSARYRCIQTLTIALGVLLLGPAALAQSETSESSEPSSSRSEKDSVVALRARQLANEGRCVEALPELERAREGRPEDAALALLEGQCRVATFAYGAAESPLQDARRLDPGLNDVALYLAVIAYHSERFEVAEREINGASGHVSNAALPQYHLYRGLILLSLDQAREAGLALERARMANAAQVEPVASYYAGLAWQSLSERDLAREAFERVIAVDPEGSWGRRAEAALAGRGLDERSWASLRAGMEYDTNVVLNGSAIPLPQGISDESDGRGVWFLEGGAELFRAGEWSGGVVGAYAGNAHFDFHEFDTHYPTLAGWIDRGFGTNTLLRFRYTAGHAWVDYENFVTTQNAILSLFHGWGAAGNTEVSATWEWNRYYYDILQYPQASDPAGTMCNGGALPCAPLGVDTAQTQDRDGNGLRLGLVHNYPVTAIDSRFAHSFILRGGYAYGRYWAEGQDWDAQNHEFLLGFEVELPFKLYLDTLGVFAYRPFDNPSTYGTPPLQAGQTYALSSDEREDKLWLASAILERPINDLISVSARYSYHRSISNSEVFDYKRHIVGGYLTLSF